MKNRFYPPYAPQPGSISNHFVRGFVAAGLLSALQNSGAPQESRPLNQKKILRLALQGGTAVAAGVATADALEQKRYTSAIASLAIGAVGVALLEKMISSSSTVSEGSRHGQEKEV